MKSWIEVNTEEELKSTYNFPQCPEEKFKQIYEVVSGIHSLRKGQAVHSHLRRCEVEEDYDEDDIADYEGKIYTFVIHIGISIHLFVDFEKYSKLLLKPTEIISEILTVFLGF